MRFRLSCIQPGRSDDVRYFYYDNETGLLHDRDGVSVGAASTDLGSYTPSFKASPGTAPIRKHAAPRILKVQLGLSCNYSCSYCLQKAVERAGDATVRMIPGFIDKIERHLSGCPQIVQLWGGEPLVYIKALIPLVAELKRLYRGAKFTMITNGSLLTQTINDWIIDNEIGVSLSHDGPGQRFRGPDPFENPDTAAAILDLYRRKKAQGDPLTFGAMIHAQNPDRAVVARWFREKLGDPDVVIGEGAIIEVYDPGARLNSPRTAEDRLTLRRISLDNIRSKADRNFSVSRLRMSTWLDTMWHGRMLDGLGMKCGMDAADTLTVDLLGQVVTCQNVSAAAKAPNGEPHLAGSIADIDRVSLDTSTHFANRRHCLGCPVVQLCRGGCMYLVGDLFDDSCNNTYTDHIPYFAAAVEALTGYLPIYIEDEAGRLPDERKDVFGLGELKSGGIARATGLEPPEGRQESDGVAGQPVGRSIELVRPDRQ